jgi:glutathione S-transferase
LADIFLFSFLEFGATVGQPLPEELTALQAWQGRMRQRPAVGPG